MSMRLECTLGDISQQDDLDAVVNAANAQLQTGGGVAGAIHRVAGPELAEYCRKLAPIDPGEAVITPAFKLPNRYVIHCLGPVYGRDEPAKELLAACYRQAIALARQADCQSLGLPALSTGAFGYPMSEAVEIAATVIREAANEIANDMLLRFVLFDETALHAHQAAFHRAGI